MGTLIDTIWESHLVRDFGDGFGLIYLDRIVLHELSGVRGLLGLERRGLPARRPDLCFATLDHTISSAPGRREDSTPQSAQHLPLFRRLTAAAGIRLAELDRPGQGIVHVVAPELGLVLPGTTFVCGDSHSCANGALGALAWGIGTADLELALATQTAVLKRPRTLRIDLSGRLRSGVTPKDAILHVIGQAGADAGVGYAVEFAGALVASLDVEARLTLCSMAIELGALFGLVAPDDTTFSYLAGRPFAPKGAQWDLALGHWRGLMAQAEGPFDSEMAFDVSDLAPQVTWGNTAGDVVPVDGQVPDPDRSADPARRAASRRALAYMGVSPGMSVKGLPLDWVFIGSCTNGRLSDLRAAASLLQGRKVAPGLRAWVVPGSVEVKTAAEAEGLDRLFLEAGFEWRTPGCSLCLGANGEVVGPKERCLATSNRNFVGRQGPQSRTHIASPLTAVASAIAGRIADPRELMG